MGGDDLESEDEYLDQSWATKTDKRISNIPDESALATGNDSNTISNKRGRAEPLSPTHPDDDDGEDRSKKQKTLSTTTPKNLLLHAGRGIANENTNVQAVFLWTCFTHFRNHRRDADGDNEDGDNDANTNAIDQNDKFKPSQFATSSDSAAPNGKYDRSIVTFLKSGVLPSMKRLKRWKHTKSPMVLIVTLSARRAVSILKDLSSLNLRVAKLFAKHMDVADQVAMLDQNSYGVAVCTPNRVLKLFQDGALELERTEVLLLDCHEDAKRFTVCTMNDTAPDLMEFIEIAVLPQVHKRKTIKFALF